MCVTLSLIRTVCVWPCGSRNASVEAHTVTCVPLIGPVAGPPNRPQHIVPNIGHCDVDEPEVRVRTAGRATSSVPARSS